MLNFWNAEPFKNVGSLINHKLIGVIEKHYSQSTCHTSGGELKELPFSGP